MTSARHSDTEAGVDISVIVPVYNGSASIGELCAQVRSVLTSHDAGSFEIILIDDCSSDESWQVLEALSAESSHIHAVRFTRNFGQHNALLCGIRRSRGRVIVTLDDDLQHPPAEIPKLLERLDDDPDVVYGTPIQQKHNLSRALASKVTKWVLQRGMGADTARHVSAFRAFRASVAHAFDSYESPNVNLDIMLTWVTNRFAAIPVQHNPRAHGRTGYTFAKLRQHTFNMVTGFSTVPLQLAGYVGIAFAILGFFILLYILVALVIYGTVVRGFTFLASIITVFSGVQLLTIGIIGEYLARIHSRTMNKPAYVVRDETP